MSETDSFVSRVKNGKSVTYNFENVKAQELIEDVSELVNSVSMYPRASPQSLSGETVVIVHGAGSGGTGYGFLKKALENLGANVHVPNYLNLEVDGSNVKCGDGEDLSLNFTAKAIENLVHYIDGDIQDGSNNFIDINYPSEDVSNNDTSLNNFILVAHSWGGIPATYLMRVMHQRIKRYVNLAAAFPNVNGTSPAERGSYQDCNPGFDLSNNKNFYDIVGYDGPTDSGGGELKDAQNDAIFALQTMSDSSYNFDGTDISYIFDDETTNLSDGEGGAFNNKLTFMLPEQDYSMGFDADGANVYFKQLNNYGIKHARILRPPGGHMLPYYNGKLCAEWIYFASRMPSSSAAKTPN